jgi:hypothetical protein
MADPAPIAPPPDNGSAAPRSIHFWPLFSWLALQMLALLAAGFRIPFSARFPAPEEQLAIHEMLVMQTIASALLFPALFPTFATAVAVVAATPIMLLLSAALAGHPLDTPLLALGAYSTLWVASLGLWHVALGTPRARLLGVAGAGMAVTGGAVLAYLSREFGAPTTAFDWHRSGWLGPLVGGMSLLEAGPATETAWAFVGLSALAGTLVGGFRRVRSRKAV